MPDDKKNVDCEDNHRCENKANRENMKGNCKENAPTEKSGSRLLATVLVLLALFVADRVVFFLRDGTGSLCDGSPATKPVVETSVVSFDVANPCFASGIRLKKGNVYRFRVRDDLWHDGRHKADADGLRRVPFLLVVSGPSRRHVLHPWMKLMGRVGETRMETFAIGSGMAAYKAKTDGELFLYVNDAVIGLALGRHWAQPYFWSSGRNDGTAHVTVSLVHGVDGVR